MPTKRTAKLLGALATLALLLVLPASAQASIAFVRGAVKTSVFTAKDSGKGIHRVASGNNPHVSPDGATVAYFHEGSGGKQELKLAPVAGGAGKTLMVGFRETSLVSFSPDSEFVLAERGGELGVRKLVLITVATGAQKVVASGYFSGFGFDPEGKQIVYAKSNSEKFPPRSDVYRVSAAGGKSVALTHDHVSEFPLWGPAGKIVFVRLIEGEQRRYAPKNELYLMNPNGKGVARLTHTKVDQLLQGLIPTAWSANGKRLLTQFVGQDTSYAVGVNVDTGAQRPIVEATGEGLFGTAISPDGKTVYGGEGGFEPMSRQTAVSVPFAGGKPKVLVKNAFLPSFSF